MNLLKYVYDELAEINCCFTHQEFSRKYLGQSGDYYCCLNLTGDFPSADAMLNLWEELIKEREKYVRLLSQSQCAQEQEIFGGWIAIYKRLADEVFSSLENHGSA